MLGVAVAVGEVRHQAGEVDEPSYGAVGDGVADVRRGHPVEVGEAAVVQGVHEVADRVDVAQRLRDRGGSATSQRCHRTSSPHAKRSGSGSEEDEATTWCPAASRSGTSRDPT